MDTDLAKELLGIVKGTKDFMLEQTPIVLKQLVAWNIATHVAGIVLGLAFLGIARWGWKQDKHYKDAWPFLVTGFGLLIGVLVICFNAYDLIQLIFAPKIFLLEYLGKLVRTR